MRLTLKLAAILVVALLVGMAFQPALANPVRDEEEGSRNVPLDVVPEPFRNLDKLVASLIAATTNTTDTDNDTIPDRVEWVIGTDPENADSDYDRLSDMEEVMDTTDPLEPDSNGDGIPDLYETRDGSEDLDGDGVPNAWDSDNDDDGVSDRRDLCPFVKTDSDDSHHFDINTSGEPITIHFQLRTKNPDNMRLIHQVWDWPHDGRGIMQDMDDSTDDVTIIPVLELHGTEMPDDPELVEFGIITHADTAYLSLYPIYEFGEIIALQGQMYYPPTNTPQNLSFDLELRWRVSGKTDKPVQALKVDDSHYLTVADDGTAYANAEVASTNELFEVLDDRDGKIALKTSNGLYLSLMNDGSIAASSPELTRDEWFVREGKDGFVLKARNGKYLRTSSNGVVRAEATSSGAGSSLRSINMGIRPESTILASYQEPFILTGFALEESHGTDVAVLWNQVEGLRSVGANLYLVYNYLRNATTEVTDIPQFFADNGIDMNVTIRSFNRTDEAVQAVMMEMLHEVIETFPDDEILPIITTLKERYVFADMSTISHGSHVLSGDLWVNVPSLSMITKKIQRMMWYKKGLNEPVEIDQVIEGMTEEDGDPEDLTALFLMLVAWSEGEEVVVSVGSEVFEIDESEVIKGIGFGVSIISKSIKGIKGLGKALFYTKVLQSYSYLLVHNILPWFVGTLAKIAKEGLVKGVTWSSKVVWHSIKAVKDVHTAVGSLQRGVFGFVNVFNKIMKWSVILTIPIDLMVSVFTILVIASTYDLTTMAGIYAVVLYSIMILAYTAFNIFLTVISFIPVYGWIFSLLGITVALLDAIGYAFPWIGKSISRYVMDTLVDLVTDFKTLTEVDLQTDSAKLEIDDGDDNGLTAGDRIMYETVVLAHVSLTDDGRWENLEESHIEPSLWVSAPYGSNSLSNTEKIRLRNISDGTTFYENAYLLRAWAEPGSGMANYPFTFGMTTDIKIVHEDCWWLAWWHCDKKAFVDTVTSKINTVYIDVLPASVSDFANWKVIKSNDADGDGLNNTQETNTSPWRWDTDADGLSDSFELDLGTDPQRYDTDGDGLNDKEECVGGTNPQDSDSDGDGLTDYLETAGWIVTFEYEGSEFDWHINSNPILNDTDGDGLDDHKESLTLQNARSKDTNGDGTIDGMRDYTISELAFKRYLDPEAHWPSDVVIDDDGFMYVPLQNSSGNGHVVKYAPNGTVVDRYYLGGILEYPRGITMDEAGRIWIGTLEVACPIIVMERDGTVVGTWSQDSINQTLMGVKDLAIDSEGYVYVTTVLTKRVEKYDANGTYIMHWGDSGSGVGELSQPGGLAVDDDGNVYVVDSGNHCVKKYDTNGTFLKQIGSLGAVPGKFENPTDIEIDRNGDLIIGEGSIDFSPCRIQKIDKHGRPVANVSRDGAGNLYLDTCPGLGLTDDTVVVADERNRRLVEFHHNVTLIPAQPLNDFLDTDGDGLIDDDEEAGWEITVAGLTGRRTFIVDSDAMVVDTDQDTLDDTMERALGSNPRVPDTDGDGLDDAMELGLGTNLTNWDTDGDGLDDGTEVTFDSDPLVADTDGEGLDDLEEFLAGSHPRLTDTDEDGLDDARELEFNSSLIDPDSDDDFMFDGSEWDNGTLPNNTDHDGDGLQDGHEFLYSTDPTIGDSDDDGLSDGLEVSMVMNPLSNDTDGDGVKDSVELEVGLNPRSGDSDADGVPDGLDRDHEILLDDTVYIVVDDGADSAGLVSDLRSKVDVEIVTLGELLSDHRDARYIVLIGSPNAGAGTAGATIRSLLQSTPDILEGMRSAEDVHLAVRYGVWTETQTVVMLSKTYASDHFRVLGILKSMVVKVTDNALTFNYLSPRSCFKLDDVDTVHETDATVWTKLDEMAVFSVDLASYTDEDTPHKLTTENGLEGDGVPLGKYIELEVSEEIQGAEGEIVTGATLRVYYTVDELDMTGDGDADDPVDIDEETLALYVHDEDSGNWTRLTPALDWVKDAGVDTTDVELYGKEYAGNVWANVTHLSLFGVGGELISSLRTTAMTGPDVTVKIGEEVTFDGTGSGGNGEIERFKWTFYYRSRTITLYGANPTFTFKEKGMYEVTLEVKDTYNGIGAATFNVTVKALTMTVRVGPIVDQASDPVFKATVRMTLGDQVLTKTSSFSGFADFVVNATAVGSEVTVRIQKEGFEPQEYQAVIGTNGELDQSPQPLVKAEATEPPPEDEKDAVGWQYGAAIVLMLVILLYLLFLTGKRPRPSWKRDEDEKNK